MDDIELQRLDADKLLLKCTRLARLAGTDEVRTWLKHEMEGYNGTGGVSLKYMAATGRWTNFKEKLGYYGPLAEIDGNLQTYKQRIEASRVDSLSGDALIGAIRTQQTAQQAFATAIARMTRIRSTVLSLLHTFVTNVYYERQFADVAETTFEQYKKEVDSLIATLAGSVLTKLPSVVARLREGDDEAISQALTTCRRIIESFADAIYPPTTGTYELGGNQLTLDASKHLNRINVYIAKQTESKSRRDRLRQNISNLYVRVSAGVHADVTAEEAFSLFLNVYMFLGEVLHLGDVVKPETIVE